MNILLSILLLATIFCNFVFSIAFEYSYGITSEELIEGSKIGGNRLSTVTYQLLDKTIASGNSFENSNSINKTTSSAPGVEDILSNYLTAVSFLVGTTSFVLGVYMQSYDKLSCAAKKFYRLIMLGLLIPSIIITILALVILVPVLYVQWPYVIIFVFLFMPEAIILVLISKNKFY